MTTAGASRLKVYCARDAPAGGLAQETVALLGFGNLGRSVALNLRDSGINVRIGNREDEYADLARADGFEVVPLATAAADSVVFILLPDEVIPAVFESDIASALRPGSAIAFASGYSLAFGLVHPSDTVDVLLVAPRMAGITARTRYLTGEGFWACVGVEADRSGRAQHRMLALAEALGILRAGAIEMSAKVEALLDLFVEQSVGAMLGMAIMIAFDVGREAGLPPRGPRHGDVHVRRDGSCVPGLWGIRLLSCLPRSRADRHLRRHHTHSRDGPRGPDDRLSHHPGRHQ